MARGSQHSCWEPWSSWKWLARVCRAVWTRREVGLVRGSAVTQAGTVRAVDSPETMGCSGGSKEWLWEVDGDRGNNR